MVSEGGAGPLQLVDERDQVLHGRRREIWPDQIARREAVGEIEVGRRRGEEGDETTPTAKPRLGVCVGRARAVWSWFRT